MTDSLDRRSEDGNPLRENNYVAVTAFSPSGYALYGRRFIESFLEHWPIPLVAYVESQRLDVFHPRLLRRDLDLDPERAEFLRRYDRPEFRGSDDYATQAIRFSHKVFALTTPIPSARWCLWIDADVETFAPVTPGVLETICPEGYVLSYLGRQHSPHSETGFIACRVDDPSVGTMLACLRRLYTSGDLFALDATQRNDAASFDRVRALVPADRQFNLSRNATGTHVWPQTPLGGVMRHWKGQARKREAYGGIVA